MKFRSASQHALFNSLNDLKWYLDRVGGYKKCNRKILTESLQAIVKMISPLAPHLAEEIWEKMKGNGFVSVAGWPEADMKKISKNAVELEQIFKKTIDDMRNIMKMAGKKNSVYLYAVTEKEFDHLEQGKEFIKKQFGFKKISVFKTSDPKKHDPKNKAAKAKYGKPGIYLE
jgi:leucyl-tRNA synthetase